MDKLFERKMIINKILIPKYSNLEEIINSVSHGIGSILSIYGLILLTNTKSIEALVFGITLFLLYTISCIYHAIPFNLEIKKLFRLLDHCMVFLLVFGTIVPVALVGIGKISGVIYFFLVLILTIIGLIFTITKLDKVQILEVICHLVNGWGIILFSKTLITNCGILSFIFIILGGMVYTIGAVLYCRGAKKKYYHSVFHFFCLFGSFFHFLAIYLICF